MRCARCSFALTPSCSAPFPLTRRAPCTPLAPQLPFHATPSSAAEGCDRSSDEEEELEPGFVSLEELRGAAAQPVRVRASGSDGYDAFVSYHVNKQPYAANKPLLVTLFAVLYDLLINGALQYAVGAHAAVRAPEGDAWRYGVLPNRVGVHPTLAVLFMPGPPGVGKTTAVKCVAPPRRCPGFC